MSRSSKPSRLPADVYDAAAAASHVTSRTVPQQIARWARIREEWTERMAARRATLDYADRFSGAGESYSELDEDGNLVIHPAC